MEMKTSGPGGFRRSEPENTFCPFCRTLVVSYRPVKSKRTMSFECKSCGALYVVRFEDFKKQIPVERN